MATFGMLFQSVCENIEATSCESYNVCSHTQALYACTVAGGRVGAAGLRTIGKHSSGVAIGLCYAEHRSRSNREEVK